MKTIKILSALSVAVFLFAGCNYLDTMPGDTLTGDHYWMEADDIALQQYCNTYYPKLIVGHGDPNGWDCGDMFKADYQSDNILQAGQNLITHGQNLVSTSDSKWSWSVIRGCNTFINNYQKSPASAAAKNYCAGQIYFFKAWDYFNKLCRFGEVPWYDTGSEKDDPDLYKPRDTRDVVIGNIIKTLDKSIELLPNKTNPYKVSKDAALCLKARVCLYEGTWRRYRDLDGDEELLKLAWETAGELMSGGYGYSLFTEGGPEQAYLNFFIQTNYRGNPEIILAKEYEPSINMGNDVTYMMVNSAHGMSRDCYEEYLCANTGLPISLCSCHKYTDGYLKETSDRDLRLVQSICVPDPDSRHSHFLYRTVNGVKQGGAPNIMTVLDSEDPRYFYANSSSGYAICKFYNQADWDVQKAHHGSIDAPVMRYAEILLIRAEAGAELGLLTQADLDMTVNQLRKRVGFPFPLNMTPVEDPDLVSKYPNITGPNPNLIREIRRERRVELFCEGYRWDDICRWHVGDEVFNKRERRGAYMDPALYTASEIERVRTKIGLDKNGFILPYEKRGTIVSNFTEKNYLFNIPLNQITLNPNLTQNPGWEE